MSRPDIQIVACYVTANEADNLAESIRSLKAYVDRFVIIDAIFIANPHPNTHSSDNSRQVAERLCAAPPEKPLTYIESAAKLTQAYARNAYLEQVQPPDWAFVVDSDEVLYGNHESILETIAAIKSRAIVDNLTIPVYTVAVNVAKNAPEITPEEYDTAPLITTVGDMPRLFAAQHNLRYTVERGQSTPALTFEDEYHKTCYLKPTAYYPGPDMFLINHHTQQSLEAYQNDYVWETEGVVR